MNAFRNMTNRHLFSVIHAIVAARHAFDNEGSLWSCVPKGERVQAWAEKHVDRLEAELHAACAEFLGRDISDPDEQRDRELALASAYNWVCNPSFSVEIKVSPRPQSRRTAA